MGVFMLDLDRNEVELLAQKCPADLKRNPEQIEAFEDKRLKSFLRLLDARLCGGVHRRRRRNCTVVSGGCYGN
jgi:hypothetical protein